MRTTGLRVSPLPALGPGDEKEVTPSVSQPIEFTIDHSVNLICGDHPKTTFAVISQILPTREGLANELARAKKRSSLCDLSNFPTPLKSSPPPKPPRTLDNGETPKVKKEKAKRSVSHPGPPITPTALYELKRLERKSPNKSDQSELSPLRPISSPFSDHNDYLNTCSTIPRLATSSSTPSPSRGLFRTKSTSTLTGKSQMAWQSFRRRIFPDETPPAPSTSTPPAPSSASIFYPPLPTPPDSGPSTSSGSPSQPTAVRPKVSQVSTQSNATPPRNHSSRPSPEAAGASAITSTRNGPNVRAVSAPEAPVRNNARPEQGPISTISEFESTCKQVFHLQRYARSMIEQKQYNKAALKYQMALGLIDKVLKTRVLTITPHEATRQRLFHLQEAVFSSRKESLNGFTDAQAAVDLPQELSTTSPPPGAPPSYQDVLREDRRRVRGAPPPIPVRPPILNASSPESGKCTTSSQSQTHHQRRSQQIPPHRRGQPSQDQSQIHLPPRQQPTSQTHPPVLLHSQTSTQLQQTNTNNSHLPDMHAPNISQTEMHFQIHTPTSNQSQSQPQTRVPPSTDQSRTDPPVSVPSSTYPQNHSETHTVHPASQPETLPHENLSSNNQSQTQSSVQVQTDFQLNHLPQSQTPPKPKPRTSLPKFQEKPIHQIPQTNSHVTLQPILETDPNSSVEMRPESKFQEKTIHQVPQNSSLVTLQPTPERDSKNPAETNPEAKNEECNTELKSLQKHSSKESACQSGNAKTKVKEEPKQPAYLQNQAQPIGDLIRQASLRGINPIARIQRPKSMINDEIQISTQISGGSSQEEYKINEELNFTGVKMRTPEQTSLQRPKSHYHQDKKTEISFHVSEEGLYDVPRLYPKSETTQHKMFEQDFTNSNDNTLSKSETNGCPIGKPGTRPRPPKPARRKVKENKVAQEKMNDSHFKNENIIVASKIEIPLSEDKNSDSVIQNSQSISNEPRIAQNKKDSTISDPFSYLDPFPPLIPGNDQSDVSFTEKNINATYMNTADSQSSTQSQARKDGGLKTPIKPVHASNVLLQPTNLSIPNLTESTSDKNHTNASTAELGDSILDALDFAVSPIDRRVLLQVPKERNYSRCHSEETLLDYSYNTLGKYLESAGSQFDVIDEFDPLSSKDSSNSTLNEDVIVGSNVTEDCGSNITLIAAEGEAKLDESYYAVPRKLKSKSPSSADGKKSQPQQEMKDKRIVIEDPDNFYENTKPNTLDNNYDKNSYAASPYHIYAEVGTHSSVASSSSSGSWPSKASNHPSSPTPTTPSTAGISSHDSCGPWSSIYEESEDEIAEDVGRSAFYHSASSNQGSMDSLASYPPAATEGYPGLSSSSSSNNTSRELLKIREGVKIFFIHADGVITSPWNRPFLSVSKDAGKPLLGQNLLLRVGRNLWWCELISKTTLVFKSDSSTYIFKETNNKPECIAVAVRIPSTVRKVQHELLLRIMQDHSRIEEERPSGITKSVSKGAASAADRVNKIVENKEADFNQAFVRRNSIRALKGMSRRLNSLAQKTGSNMPELPEEYHCLRDAANTLRLSRSSRTVQYI